VGGIEGGRHTDCTVQAYGTEDVSGAALGVAEKSSGAESSSTASGSEGGSGSAGGEGEDGVTHLEDLDWGFGDRWKTRTRSKRK
jgi:hypothetical protein